MSPGWKQRMERKRLGRRQLGATNNHGQAICQPSGCWQDDSCPCPHEAQSPGSPHREQLNTSLSSSGGWDLFLPL